MKIKAKFKHSRKGVVFQRDEEITNLSKAEQEEAVLNGLAYYDKPKKEIEADPSEYVNMSNTKDEIKAYMDKYEVEYTESMTKEELLTAIDEAEC